MPRWTIQDDDDQATIIEVEAGSSLVTMRMPPAKPRHLDVETAQELRLILAAAIREAKRHRDAT